MSKRLAFLAAASPLALIALPAQAQVDDHHAGAEAVIETYSDPVVQDISGPESEWESEEAAAGASYAHDGHGGYAEEVNASQAGEWADEPAPPMHGMHRMHHMGRSGSSHQGMMPGQPRQLAYSPEQRAEWLAQCRALHAEPQEPVYLEAEEDADGGLIGGLIGAVAGGVVGNEVRHRHRLAGTLIGAGLGGIAGAVIGSAIDNADDDDRRVVAPPQEPGFDYCEAYLINYERGYGVPQQLAHAPVMMVPVAQGVGMGMQHHGGARRIIEEEIEVDADEAATPSHHTARRVIHRQPEGDKRTPIN